MGPLGSLYSAELDELHHELDELHHDLDEVWTSYCHLFHFPCSMCHHSLDQKLRIKRDLPQRIPLKILYFALKEIMKVSKSSSGERNTRSIKAVQVFEAIQF